MTTPKKPEEDEGDGTHPAAAHLHSMEVSAVRLVPKGANGRNGMLVMKADEPVDATDTPVPDQGGAPGTAAPAHQEPATQVDKSVSLREGESVDQFTGDLRTAFSAAKNQADAEWENRYYVETVFDAFLVASKGGDYWRFDWTRDAKGEFTFGEAQEVERKVTFQPVAAKTAAPTESTAPAPAAETPPAAAPEPPTAAPAPAPPEQPAAKGAKSAKEKIQALARALRESFHQLVDEAMSTPAPSEDPKPEPAAKSAPAPKPAPEQGRPNALSTSAAERERFQWFEGNLNDLRRSSETGDTK